MAQLSQEDVKVIKYLARYKIMLVEDTKLIYHSEWYHRKRVKRMIEEGYVKKYKFYYIELDKKGRKVAGTTGKDYIKNKNNEAYMERLKQISHLATMTIDSDIELNPSWEIKQKEIYTDAARKYLGELVKDNKKYLVYYISNKKETRYIHQLFYDINKVMNYEKIIIFLDSFDKLQKEYNHLAFGKSHTYIIINSNENRELIKQYDDIDFYELVKYKYGQERQILISDWKIADYILEENHYILNMLFVDTEKLNELKWFFQENNNSKKKIDIITLEENQDIIKQLAPNNSKIIGLNKNNLLKGAKGGEMEFKEE